MKTMQLWTADGRLIARDVRMAYSFIAHSLGLLRHPLMELQDGLLLSPGGSIHTIGMRSPIDIVFLSGQLRILGLAPGVPPWRLRLAPAGTGRVLELPAGQIAATGLTVGTYIVVEPRSDDARPRSHRAPREYRDAAQGQCQRQPIQFSLRLPLARRCMSREVTGCSAREITTARKGSVTDPNARSIVEEWIANQRRSGA